MPSTEKSRKSKTDLYFIEVMLNEYYEGVLVGQNIIRAFYFNPIEAHKRYYKEKQYFADVPSFYQYKNVYIVLKKIEVHGLARIKCHWEREFEK